MAYPTISGPYGLRPINLIGGQVFAGATRQRRIVNSSASSIGFGDPVKFDANGCVVVCTETTAAPATGFAGVFMGCTFVSSVTGQPTFSQAWISGTAIASNTYIVAYICEDPDQLFQVCGVSGTTVVSTTSGFTYTDVGLNVTMVANTLNTTTKDSRYAVDIASGAVTETYPLRVIDVVPDTAFTYSGTLYYPEVIVKFNAPYVASSGGITSTVTGGHAYYNPVGL
jgi:hypothetical protein